MQFGCCTTMEYYDELARLGFDCIELPGKVVAAMDAAAFEAVAARVAAGPLPCCGLNAYCPPEIVIAGPGWDLRAARDYAERLLPRARQLGARSVGIGAPASRILPEGFDRALARRQLVEFLRATAEVADRCGLTLLLEAVCTRECNFVNTTPEALEILQELALPNLFLVYDIYHAAVMGEDPALLDAAFPLLRHVHICRDAQGERTYLKAQRPQPYRRYVDRLLALGYDGAISLEAFCGDVPAGAARSLEILRQMTGLQEGGKANENVRSIAAGGA